MTTKKTSKTKRKTKAKKKTAKKKAPGRPTSFNENLAMAILEFAKTGATDSEIAEKFGISESTLYLWKNKHPSFSEALKKSKDVADELVKAALFKRAVGYEHPAIKIHYDKDRGEFATHEYTERYPPDTTACIFWMKNRQPDEWRDVSRRELTGKDGKSLDGPQIVVTLPSNGREGQGEQK